MEFRSPPTSFDRVYEAIAGIMTTSGELVNTGHWQSLPDVPQTRTLELRNVVVDYQIPNTMGELVEQVKPNNPWAEAQFQERVGREPLNPGRTYHLWPYYAGNVPKHQDPNDGDKFSHTYMERFWPRRAGGHALWDEETGEGGLYGIRYRYGDYDDVVSLLERHPFTRQAYLPIFFPEDTGAHADQRIPCTLGYHLMRRDNQLHCFYPMRSCDFLRHFRDDIYLAARLVQWTLLLLTDSPHWGDHVKPGRLTFHAHSLHVFEPEKPLIRRLAGLTDEPVYGVPA